jgi:hypothetical protein
MSKVGVIHSQGKYALTISENLRGISPISSRVFPVNKVNTLAGE